MTEENKELEYVYHYTVKKVTEDYESLNFNTAISQMMIFINAVYKQEVFPREYAIGFLKLLNPIAPHITEELNEMLGVKECLATSRWPSYDESKTVKNDVEIAVQVNGKLRGTISVNKDEDRSEYVSAIIPTLQELCDYANQYDMNVMVENMPGDGELGFSPNELLTIFKNVDRKNIKFILDTGHAYVSGYPLTEFVYLLKDYLYHMHFNDNDGSCDQHKRMHLGTIDFDSLFTALITAAPPAI